MDVTIYSLSDPVSGAIRYVGKTMLGLGKRLMLHVREKNTNHKSRWIQSLSAKGLSPVIEELEVICNSNDEDWQEVERFWIAYLGFIGCRLTNLDSGGRCGKCITEEVKRKIGDANRGRPSHRKGGHLSQAHKDNIGAANKNKSPWHKGQKLSDVHKKNLSDMQKRSWGSGNRKVRVHG